MVISAIHQMLNAPSAMMLFLLILVLIFPTEAAVSCDPSSPQCCWVVRIWQLMGKTTSVSSTSSNDCCNMEGVTCTGPDVTQINWNKLGLTQQIPSDIRNLKSLTLL